MDKEKQDKLWNDLSEETREAYREKYKFHLVDSQKNLMGDDWDKNIIRSQTIVKELETMFGEHNLNPKPPTPKTWEDVEKDREDEDCYFCEIGNAIHKNYVEGKLAAKLLATYKIAKLIDLGYGGQITDKEWENSDINKFSIVPYDTKEGLKIVTHIFNSDKRFISFHTLSQAEEFISYKSNIKLAKQYYIM